MLFGGPESRKHEDDDTRAYVQRVLDDSDDVLRQQMAHRIPELPKFHPDRPLAYAQANWAEFKESQLRTRIARSRPNKVAFPDWDTINERVNTSNLPPIDQREAKLRKTSKVLNLKNEWEAKYRAPFAIPRNKDGTVKMPHSLLSEEAKEALEKKKNALTPDPAALLRKKQREKEQRKLKSPTTSNNTSEMFEGESFQISDHEEQQQHRSISPGVGGGASPARTATNNRSTPQRGITTVKRKKNKLRVTPRTQKRLSEMTKAPKTFEEMMTTLGDVVESHNRQRYNELHPFKHLTSEQKSGVTLFLNGMQRVCNTAHQVMHPTNDLNASGQHQQQSKSSTATQQFGRYGCLPLVTTAPLPNGAQVHSMRQGFLALSDGKSDLPIPVLSSYLAKQGAKTAYLRSLRDSELCFEQCLLLMYPSTDMEPLLEAERVALAQKAIGAFSPKNRNTKNTTGLTVNMLKKLAGGIRNRRRGSRASSIALSSNAGSRRGSVVDDNVSVGSGNHSERPSGKHLDPLESNGKGVKTEVMDVHQITPEPPLTTTRHVWPPLPRFHHFFTFPMGHTVSPEILSSWIH